MKINPKKSLGQNFLINAGILEKIVSAVELTPNDTVLEIGPGTGNLTKLLSEKAGQVIAIEKDHRLIGELKEQFKNTNVEIIEEDVLKLDIDKLFKNSDYKVVGNIPYYITSHLLKTIFEGWSRSQSDRGSSTESGPMPKLIVLTVQKEVAQRIVAKPPDMNLLALSVQLYAEPKIIGYISRGSFRPIPKVDSAIIKLVPKKDMSADKDLFFKLIKAGFAGKRKQLAKNLAKNFGILKKDVIEILKKVGAEPKDRAENLSLDQWTKLSRLIKN